MATGVAKLLFILSWAADEVNTQSEKDENRGRQRWFYLTG